MSSLEDLKTAPVLRKRKPFEYPQGAEIDLEDIEESVNNLAAYYAGLPEFAGASFDIVKDGVPPVNYLFHLSLRASLTKRRLTLISVPNVYALPYVIHALLVISFSGRSG